MKHGIASYFSDSNINYGLLKQRAFNLRWANMPEGVIPLTAADPDFPVAEPIKEAICRFAAEGYFSYAPAEGYLFFREAISRFYEEKRNLRISPDGILPVDSAAFGIYAVCKAVLKEGDEAIVFDPVDFLFRYNIEQVGGVAKPLPIPIDPTQSIDLQALTSAIGPKTKMLCLCNPVNPNGKVFTKSELEKILEIARRFGLLVLSDEIWSDIVFSPSVFTSFASLDEDAANRTITVSGFSKSYGLAGLRAGFVMTSNAVLFKNIMEASGHASTVHGCNTIAQVAGAAALNDCQDWLRAFVDHLKQMRDLSLSEVSTIPGFSCNSPQGCYLLFCNIQSTGLSGAELHSLLLEKAKVAVVPGLPRWFGEKAEGHIRICFSTSEALLKEAFQRIRTTLISEIKKT